MNIEATNKRVVEQFVRDVKERNNPAAADQLLHPEFAHHFPIPGLPPGREGFEAIRGLLGQAFSAPTVEVEVLLADGDKVAERSVATAKHIGEFLGVPATNKTVRWSETHIYRLKDGKIIEHWPELDLLGVMQQINPQPAPR